MTNSNLLSRDGLADLIKKNTELLGNDLKGFLDKDNKQTAFEVTEVYYLLYSEIMKILGEQFTNFNIDEKYTKEVENSNLSIDDKRYYYDTLFWNAIHTIIIYKEK